MPHDARAERAELAPFGCNEKLMGYGAECHAKSMASPKQVGQVFDCLWRLAERLLRTDPKGFGRSLPNELLG